MLRYTFLAVGFLTLAFSLAIPSGHIAAQCPPCPPGGEEMGVPNVKFTNGPASIQNTRGVVFDVRWEDCTGIAEIEVRIVDKATKKQIMSKEFSTTDVTATKANWQILLPDSKKDDWVQVTVYAFTSMGAEIAKTPTEEVKLLK